MLFFYLFGVAIDDDGLLMGMLNNARWSHLLSLELPKTLTFSFAVLKLSSDTLSERFMESYPFIHL